MDPTRLDPTHGLDLLRERVSETPPGRIQLIAGPRQVGKTHLLLRLAEALGAGATYAPCDAPEAALAGWWEQLWIRAEALAEPQPHVLLLDEVHLLPEWSTRLKAQWDRVRRRKIKLHVIATGSSALHLGRGSRETLAGRFERLVFPHWSASSLATAFGLSRAEAVAHVLRWGTYPGVLSIGGSAERRSAYIRDAIVDPAIGRDLLAGRDVRRPGLLRQLFSAAVSTPAQIISLQKLQGRLQDPGALETIAHYLQLLEDAFLVAALEKYTPRASRQRAAPPKLVVLNQALLSAIGDFAPPADAGHLIENACLAHAWNAGQRVRYWREEPIEVDAITEGSWGSWAIEVKSGRVALQDLGGLLEFVRRFPRFQPLLVCGEDEVEVGRRVGIRTVSIPEFLGSEWHQTPWRSAVMAGGPV